MQRHPYFDLWLHQDGELSALTGCPVIQRTTLHEWPLACVQRLNCADGQTFIYKVQAEPTVEPDFYRLARSSLLVGARLLPVDGLPPALLLEAVRAAHLGDNALGTDEAREAADAILGEIARIAGAPPVLLDIHTPEKWLAQARLIQADVRALVDSRAFQQTDRAMVARIAACSRSGSVLAAIEDGPSGLVHSDLCAENVLALADGYRVLDWQRPLWGPTALDRVTLLESLGINPRDAASPGIVLLRRLLLIGWLAQAARYWFPPGVETYDRQIAGLVEELDESRTS